MSAAAPQPAHAIEVTGLKTQFGTHVVHEDLDFRVEHGEVMGLVGGSGTGKSVLLRTLIGLIAPAAGRVEVLGTDIRAAGPRAMAGVQRRWGVLFQDGALFSSLTVAQNVALPMQEHLRLDPRTRRRLALLKIAMVGLPPDAADKYPSELSGGMRKRAGLARALAMDPELLLLDEPTAGLDPIGAHAFDMLVRDLQRAMGLTVVMVTHDLDSLAAICDRISVLLDKRVTVGTLAEHCRNTHPWMQDYFAGPRARAAFA